MRRTLACLLLFLPVIAGCAMPSAVHPPSSTCQQRPARYQLQLDGMAEAGDGVARQALLDALWSQVAPPDGARLRWLRQMAIGGDVVLIEGVCDALQLQRLVAALAALPQVRRIEPDGMQRVTPIRGPRVEG